MDVTKEYEKEWEKLGYDNVFFPFQDNFRNDRLVAYSHRSGNRIEIYNTPYPLKFNEKNGRLMKITTDELRLINKCKEALGWNTCISIDYLTSKDEDTFGIGRRKYPFYDSKINMDRVNPTLIDVISNLSFTEICKMFREICYDQVCYYSDDNKGIIYKTDRSALNREQACGLQRKVSTAVDLFEQSVVDKREFEEKYLEERLGR